MIAPAKEPLLEKRQTATCGRTREKLSPTNQLRMDHSMIGRPGRVLFVSFFFFLHGAFSVGRGAAQEYASTPATQENTTEGEENTSQREWALVIAEIEQSKAYVKRFEEAAVKLKAFKESGEGELARSEYERLPAWNEEVSEAKRKEMIKAYRKWEVERKAIRDSRLRGLVSDTRFRIGSWCRGPA
jgi:hypothetical protein